MSSLGFFNKIYFQKIDEIYKSWIIHKKDLFLHKVLIYNTLEKEERGNNQKRLDQSPAKIFGCSWLKFFNL